MTHLTDISLCHTIDPAGNFRCIRTELRLVRFVVHFIYWDAQTLTGLEFVFALTRSIPRGRTTFIGDSHGCT